MTIHSPGGARERIMMYGAEGSGKSKSYIDIYDATDVLFHIVDTDVAVERMFANRDTSRVVHTEATDYEDAAKAFIKAGKQAKADEWVVIDLLSPTWQWCQDYWAVKTQKGLTEDSLALWMPEKKVDYDWVAINRLYNNFMANVLRTEAHIMAICEEDSISEGTWQNETDKAFKTFSKKPKGNKRNPHLFHTVIHCSRLSLTEPKFMMTSAKEREGRDCDWVKEDVTDDSFAQRYLVEVAGWEDDTPPTVRKKRKRT